MSQFIIIKVNNMNKSVDNVMILKTFGIYLQ